MASKMLPRVAWTGRGEPIQVDAKTLLQYCSARGPMKGSFMRSFFKPPELVLTAHITIGRIKLGTNK
eukprot:4972792-Amphidinium_carterae.1